MKHVGFMMTSHEIIETIEKGDIHDHWCLTCGQPWSHCHKKCEEGRYYECHTCAGTEFQIEGIQYSEIFDEKYF